MDFFASQARAKRKSLVLIIYFLLAVIATVLVINALTYLAVRYFSQTQYVSITPEYWLSGPFWWLTLAVTGVIFTGSLWRYLQLRDGGSKVATMLGAKPLDMSSRHPLHRRAINITEEISIASGMPMPAIFIMEQEESINAFVAGYQLQDMTLTLTQGALNDLSRDELQGIIAHEFSHIHNADTRLNMRIIAVLAGILLIGSIGSFLCRSSSLTRWGKGYRGGHYHSGHFRGGHFRGGTSRSRKGSAGVFAIGAALFAAGYSGLFFGRLVQAAVSRQREWLADATAVQFTRNPQGISGALAKIADNTHHSWLQTTVNAQQVNHMCFSESLKLSRWLASHPPLEQRISAIDPMFLTRQRAARNVEKVKQQQTTDKRSTLSHGNAATSGFSSGSQQDSAVAQSDATQSDATQSDVTQSDATQSDVTQSYVTQSYVTQPAAAINLSGRDIIGSLPPQNFALGQQVISHFNTLFGADLHQAEYAEALLYALLQEEASVAGFNTDIRLSTGKALADFPKLAQIHSALRHLAAGTSLSLLEIIVAVLKTLPRHTRHHIVRQTNALVVEDGRTTFAEFIIQTFVVCHLQTKTPQRLLSKSTLANSNAAAPHLELVISMFARLGSDSVNLQAVKRLFDRVSQLHFPLTPMTFRRKISGSMLRTAVTALAHLNPQLKPVLIDACIDCIKADGQIIEKEYQLLRITVELMDCPMPPLFGDSLNQSVH